MTTCIVARLNKDKYLVASKKSKENEEDAVINWFKALNKYRLKPFAMSLPSPAWWFTVNDNNVLQRILIPPNRKKRKKERKSSSPLAKEFNGIRFK